jgi:hypothetical protein
MKRYAILKYNSKMVVQNVDARYIALYKVKKSLKTWRCTQNLPRRFLGAYAELRKATNNP